jgi:hypothetical protein
MVKKKKTPVRDRDRVRDRVRVRVSVGEAGEQGERAVQVHRREQQPAEELRAIYMRQAGERLTQGLTHRQLDVLSARVDPNRHEQPEERKSERGLLVEAHGDYF